MMNKHGVTPVVVVEPMRIKVGGPTVFHCEPLLMCEGSEVISAMTLESSTPGVVLGMPWHFAKNKDPVVTYV